MKEVDERALEILKNKFNDQFFEDVGITEIRDRLVNVQSLIRLCMAALASEKDELNKKVSHVLYFYVLKEIETAEEELRNL